jgi:hypothetical protein
MTPRVLPPAGSGTSNGYPLIRDVTGRLSNGRDPEALDPGKRDGMALKRWNFEIFADSTCEKFVDFVVPRHCRNLLDCTIHEDGVSAAFS